MASFFVSKTLCLLLYYKIYIIMKIKAFKGIRPTRDKAHLVASRSYLSYSEEVLREKLLNNPYTFLHIIHPEESLGTKPLLGKEKYKKVREKYLKFLSEGVLVKDHKETLYIYRQSSDGQSFIGVIAASSVDDYLNGVIKVHEQTIASREEMFTDYLESTGFNAEPVLLTYPKTSSINEWIETYVTRRPEYEFTTTNRVLHHLWHVDSENDVAELKMLFKGVKTAYIADGHHRSASSVLCCQRKTHTDLPEDGNAPYNYFMSFLIDDEQMRIYDYNRLMRDINGLSVKDFMMKLDECFTLQKMEAVYAPKLPAEMSMYLEGVWYSLIAKDCIYHPDHCISSLDADMLSKHILRPLLGVKDIRKDERVDFLDGKQGLVALQDAVDSGGYRVAFALKPVSIQQLKRVADQKQTMPPKSTYIEPKLRSGLVIYSLE